MTDLHPDPHPDFVIPVPPIETIVVPVKSAWASKINWTQAVAVAASLLTIATGGKFDIPPEHQAEMATVITTLTALLTWFFRTWHNGSISPGSIPNAVRSVLRIRSTHGR